MVAVHPQVSLQPGPKFVTVGSDVILPICHVTGYPAPLVTWRKSSGQLPQGRAHYNNSVLQISDVRKSDSETYLCSAVNLLGNVVRNTHLVVVSLPVFTVKPPEKVFAVTGESLTLNCSATGDPRPVISWKRQGAALPVGRSHRRNDSLVIRDFRVGDAGIYICVATSAGVFQIEAISNVQVRTRGKLFMEQFHLLTSVLDFGYKANWQVSVSHFEKRAKKQESKLFCSGVFTMEKERLI